MKELGEAFLGPFIEAACDCGNVGNSQCNTNREVAVFGRYETLTSLNNEQKYMPTNSRAERTHFEYSAFLISGNCYSQWNNPHRYRCK